jgi:hypothetical protein
MDAQRGNKWILEVEFDSEVWISLPLFQKQKWLDDVTDSINEHARVSHITMKEEY